MEGFTHVGLYGGEVLNKAVGKPTPFFTSNLGQAEAGTNAGRLSLVAAK